MPPEKLSDALIKNLLPPEKGLTIQWDSEISGFGALVTKAGSRSWVLNFRTRAGIQRRMTIGSFPAWSYKAAREEAKRLRRLVDQGEDPMADRQRERDAATVADLADHYREVHLPKKRPRSQTGDESMLTRYVIPELGKLKIEAVRHADIAALHRTIGKSAPMMANRVAALLSKMFSIAIKEEWCTTNPCKGLERNAENKRERYLNPSEILRLAGALNSHPERASANAVRLLLLSGARRGEVLSAQWSEFDLEGASWSKPSSHTKQKRTHRIPLSAPALELLVGMKADADAELVRRRKRNPGAEPCPYLFPRVDGTDGHMTEIKKTWASVCKKADITNARLHDLRHTYASVLASAGLSLPIIGQLLGHTQVATTARYAHLVDDVLRSATNRAGAIIAGKPQGEVLQFKRR